MSAKVASRARRRPPRPGPSAQAGGTGKAAREVFSPGEIARRIRNARLEIDAIDREIVRQLGLRARVVAKITRVRGAEKRDRKREREIVRNAVRFHRTTEGGPDPGYPDRAVAEVFHAILRAGGAVQAAALSPRRGRGRRRRRS